MYCRCISADVLRLCNSSAIPVSLSEYTSSALRLSSSASRMTSSTYYFTLFACFTLLFCGKNSMRNDTPTDHELSPVSGVIF